MDDAPSGSRNEETRRRNLSAILRTVHYGGPTSRSELTRQTGLNRSTIKVLVDELVARELAFESPSQEASGVGRPSPLVNPGEGVYALAVNPDVDAVVVGLVGLGGRVVSRERIETQGTPSVADAARLAAKAVAGMDGDAAVGVGVAVPGLVRSTDHMVVDAPHLGWRDEDVAGAFAEALGVPAFVENDATVGLLAETRFGAAADRDVVYINGSTSGIGGAVVLGGRVLHGASGFAGEIGHTSVPGATRACRCGRTGCLETEVNLGLLGAAAGSTRFDPDRVHVALAGEVSPSLAAEVDRQVDVLAVAIANAISNFNPSTVMLAGFVGALLDARRDRLEEAVRREAFAELAEGVQLVRATLGDRRLMIGAAELAFAPLLRNPAE